MAKSIDKMTIWDVMDELDGLEDKFNEGKATKIQLQRMKDLRKAISDADKAYKAWDKVTPLHINKI